MFVWVVRRLRGSEPSDGVNDAGFSLVEVIVAIVLFALVATAATAMLVTGLATTRLERNRTAAAAIATEQLEQARNYSVLLGNWVANAPSAAAALAVPVPAASRVVGGNTYYVSQTSAWVPKATPAGACDSSTQGGSSGVQPVLLVTETVTWDHMNGTKPITQQSTFTPPNGFSANTGGIDVQVVDHANAGVPAIPVTVVGPSPSTATIASMTSDSRGCAFAGFLPPGSYTLKVAQSGYVDGQELATSTQTASVTTGTVTTATFSYDQASTITATFAGTPTPATGLGFVVSNPGLAGLGTFLPVTAATPLFPYASYNIYAGRCPEADPDAAGTAGALYPPAPAPTSVLMVAGQAASVVVPLYPLNVAIVNTAGLPVVGAVVTATEVPNPAAQHPCAGPFSTYGLQSSVAVTGISSTGMPLGKFTITATAAGKTGSVSIILTPTAVTPASPTITVR